MCWGTFATVRPGGHPCRNAYQALRDAGHDPELIKVHGLGIGPGFLHVKTEGRRRVEEMTGQPAVPVLVTDDGKAIHESSRIVEWARENPANSEVSGSS